MPWLDVILWSILCVRLNLEKWKILYVTVSSVNSRRSHSNWIKHFHLVQPYFGRGKPRRLHTWMDFYRNTSVELHALKTTCLYSLFNTKVCALMPQKKSSPKTCTMPNTTPLILLTKLISVHMFPSYPVKRLQNKFSGEINI